MDIRRTWASCLSLHTKLRASIGTDVISSVWLAPSGGKDEGMRRIPLLFVIYIVIGVVVAYTDDYFDNVEKTKRLISAILAVLLWPLVLLGFDVKVT
jgi:membrane protease YdiL (CAAX protease family)